MAMRKSLPLGGLHIRDHFWDRYTRLVRSQILPYQYRVLHDPEESHCVENLRIAAGLAEGGFKGFVFQDSDLAKWLEAAAYSLAHDPDPALEEQADQMIELIAAAQEDNGYLDTYFSIKYPGQQFKNLKEGHELYTAGHFIEAAVAYHAATGKDRFLRLMVKCADNICRVLTSPEYEGAVPGHEEIELALVKLSNATGDPKYADMALSFIDRRGTRPNYLATEHERPDFIDVWHDRGAYLPEYGQAHAPVREQSTAEGHAVRALYLYCAMADLADRYQDRELLRACERLYDNITQKRMYITGGVGSSGVLERFTTDYDLPNDSCYCESCASVALALFCRRMARITGDAKYMDTAERALVNTVLAGVSLDGQSFFYVNPLEVVPRNCIPRTDLAHVDPVRQKWFGCACCPPNIARTLASLGEYALSSDGTDLWVDLYAGGEYHVTLGGRDAELTVDSALPWEGKVSLTLTGAAPLSGRIWLRIPEYAKDPDLALDGKAVEIVPVKGYQPVELSGASAALELTFRMPARLVYADPRLHADNGKCAVMKGPLVYCLEETDNGPGLAALVVDRAKPLREVWDPDLAGGSVKVLAEGWRLDADSFGDALYRDQPPEKRPAQLTFVPYCSWGNRTPGEMRVWVPYSL